MGLWNNHIMPRLVSCACGSPAIYRHRRQIVPRARGRVLELGCGSGLNFPLYDNSSVESLVAIEPDPKMIGWAEDKAVELDGIATEFIPSGIEEAALPTASIDTAVVTFVLCTIPDWASALDELRRVLKPQGQLLFCEHGAAPDPGVARWQERVEPVWKRLAGGCHLTRSAPELLERSGFQIKELDAAYTPKTPRIAGFVSRGVALPA